MKPQEITTAKANELTFDDLKILVPARPYASVKLPSLGLYYDQNIVKDGSIELCPLSAREEKLIAGIRGHNVDDIIDTLLGRCMKTEIHPDQLLITDRFYLLLMLRANSYGEQYNFTLTCDSCGVVEKQFVNIPGDFEIKWANKDDVYPFKVLLPDCKAEVAFHLLTGKDQKEIKNAGELDQKKGLAGQGDATFLYTMAKHILTVNGKTPNSLVALEFVSRLSARDSRIFQEAYEDKTPGLIPSVSKKCSACGKTTEAALPIGAEFFRPRLRG